MLKESKKSDLKDGMIIEVQTGKKFFLFGKILIGRRTWFELDDLNDDLTSKNNYSEMNVKKVYSSRGMYVIDDMFNENKLELIWERKEEEIDWSKIPEGTKVQVRDSKESDWVNRYFNCYRPDSLCSFEIWLTKPDEFTGQGYYFSYYYRYCRIHPDVEIKKEWYK